MTYSIINRIVATAPAPGHRITFARLDGTESLDLTELYEAAGRVASRLHGLGVRPGDRPDGRQHGCHAAQRAGDFRPRYRRQRVLLPSVGAAAAAVLDLLGAVFRLRHHRDDIRGGVRHAAPGTADSGHGRTGVLRGG